MSSALERKLRSLKTQRRSIISSFSLVKNFVASYEEERDSCQVPVRLEAVASLWKDFNKVQMELETTDETADAIETYLKERAEFESAYYQVKGFLMQHTPASNDVSVAAPAPQRNNTNHIKLPDVKLPVFSGNYENWLNFHDLFVSLVHTSAELSSIQKFYYLRSSLAGEALQLIQTITISATNYPVAWNLLTEHYQNSRVLKRKYVQALFDYPTLRRESAGELHTLVESFQTNVKVLKQLGENTQHWDVLMVHLLASRLDPVTRRDWEDYSASHETVAFKELTDFIQRRVNVLQQITKPNEPLPLQPQAQAKKSSNPRLGTYGAFQGNWRKCVICSEEHPVYMCNTFSRMQIEDKENLVRQHQLCRNCLRKGHMARDCRSESSCKKCNAKHHTQLCVSTSSERSANEATSANHSRSSTPTRDDQQPSTASGSVTTAAHSGISSCSSQIPGRAKVILATAQILVVDDEGNQHTARALLDSGSECSFASERFAKLLKVNRTRETIPIAGIGKATSSVKHQFEATVKSRNSDFSKKAQFLILPKVTIDLPTVDLDTSTWNLPRDVPLADPEFHKSSSIDVVLGAEMYFDVFATFGNMYLDHLPSVVLVNSVFGWVVTGTTTHIATSHPTVCNFATVVDKRTSSKIRAQRTDTRGRSDQNKQRASHHSVLPSELKKHLPQSVEIERYSNHSGMSATCSRSSSKIRSFRTSTNKSARIRCRKSTEGRNCNDSLHVRLQHNSITVVTSCNPNAQLRTSLRFGQTSANSTQPTASIRHGTVG